LIATAERTVTALLDQPEPGRRQIVGPPLRTSWLRRPAHIRDRRAAIPAHPRALRCRLPTPLDPARRRRGALARLKDYLARLEPFQRDHRLGTQRHPVQAQRRDRRLARKAARTSAATTWPRRPVPSRSPCTTTARPGVEPRPRLSCETLLSWKLRLQGGRRGPERCRRRARRQSGASQTFRGHSAFFAAGTYGW
jgi:hypothetical protein